MPVRTVSRVTLRGLVAALCFPPCRAPAQRSSGWEATSASRSVRATQSFRHPKLDLWFCNCTKILVHLEIARSQVYGNKHKVVNGRFEETIVVTGAAAAWAEAQSDSKSAYAFLWAATAGSDRKERRSLFEDTLVGLDKPQQKTILARRAS